MIVSLLGKANAKVSYIETWEYTGRLLLQPLHIINVTVFYGVVKLTAGLDGHVFYNGHDFALSALNEASALDDC